MQTPGQQMNQLAQQNSRLANNFKECTQQNSISALVARVRARSTGAPLPFTSQGPVENSESGRGPAGCMKDSPNFLHVAGVLGCLFLIERVRCISESGIKNNPNSWVWILNTPKMLAHLLLVASIWFYLKIATFCLDWCVAGYTLGREYPTMGHGDMFSGIVTPLALSLTFCIMIGKTLAKWLQVHVFPSEPCNWVLAFENHMLHISVQLPWDYGTRSLTCRCGPEGEPQALLLPMLAIDQRECPSRHQLWKETCIVTVTFYFFDIFLLHIFAFG